MAVNITYHQKKLSKKWYAEVRDENRVLYVTQPFKNKHKVEDLVVKHLKSHSLPIPLRGRVTSEWDNTCYRINPKTGERKPM